MIVPRFLACVLLAAAVVLAQPAGAARAETEIDPFLPADTESYVSVNVRQVLDAPIVKKHLLGPAKQALEDLEEVKDVLKDLGLDPFKDLDRVIVAGPGGTDTDRGLIIGYGTFDVAKITKKAQDAARNNDDLLKIHKVNLGGGATHNVYEVVFTGQDQSMFVAVVSNKTVIASPGKDYVVDALKANKAKKKAALKNKEFQALIEKMDPKQSLSVAMLGKSLNAGADADPIVKLLTDAFKGIEAIGGGLTVNNEFKLELIVAGKDATAAREVKDALDRAVRLGLVGLGLLGENKQLGLLLEVLKTVKVTNKGKVVSVSAKLTADVLEDLFKND